MSFSIGKKPTFCLLLILSLFAFVQVGHAESSLEKIELQFQPVTDKLLSVYPFLIEENETAQQLETSLNIALVEIKDYPPDDSLLLVYYSGSYFGTAGGSLQCFRKNEKGAFVKCFDIGTGPFIYKMICNDALILVLGGAGVPSLNKWKYQSKKMEHLSSSDDINKLSIC